MDFICEKRLVSIMNERSFMAIKNIRGRLTFEPLRKVGRLSRKYYIQGIQPKLNSI